MTRPLVRRLVAIHPSTSRVVTARLVKAGPNHRQVQRGFGIVEALVALVIASVLILALAAGLLMLVRTTESNNQRQHVRLALANYSESIKALDYVDCGDAGAYTTAYNNAAASWQPERGETARIAKVEYWNKANQQFEDTCTTDGGAQQFTLEVQWRDRTDTADTVLGGRR